MAPAQDAINRMLMAPAREAVSKRRTMQMARLPQPRAAAAAAASRARGARHPTGGRCPGAAAAASSAEDEDEISVRERARERERERERERGGGGLGCSSSTRQVERSGAGRVTHGEGASGYACGKERLAEVGQNGVALRRPHVPTPRLPARCFPPPSHCAFLTLWVLLPIALPSPPPSYPFSVLAPLAVAIIFPCRFHARHWLWIRLGLEAAAGQTITRTTDEANLFIRLGYQNIPVNLDEALRQIGRYLYGVQHHERAQRVTHSLEGGTELKGWMEKVDF